MAVVDPYSRAACQERIDAWRSSTDPAVRDHVYAAVLRRHFGLEPPGSPAMIDTPPL